MMWWYGGPGWWGYLFMTVSMVAFWALIVFGIVALLRYVRQGEQRTPPSSLPQSPPEQVLAERFARGEIDESEFRQRLDALRTSGRPRT